MRRPLIPLGVLILFLVARPAGAQQSRCADCHFANPDAPNATHLVDWDRSPHGRNSVGCESCHGGNASTFERFQAHQNILNSANPASPVARLNLPKTCGACHTGPYVQFQKSRHFELMEAGNAAAPSCSTCHGDVGAHLPSPKRLMNECASCHGVGRTAPRPEYPEQGRLLLEGIREVRASLDEARPLIRRIKDKARHDQLQYAYEQAQVPLKEAADAGHSFQFDNLKERLAVSRERANALLDQLANPSAR